MLVIKFTFFPDQENSQNNPTLIWLCSIIFTPNLPFTFFLPLPIYVLTCTNTLVTSHSYPQSHLSVIYFPLAQFSFHLKNLCNFIYYRSSIISVEITWVHDLTSCLNYPTISPSNTLKVMFCDFHLTSITVLQFSVISCLTAWGSVIDLFLQCDCFVM